MIASSRRTGSRVSEEFGLDRHVLEHRVDHEVGVAQPGDVGSYANAVFLCGEPLQRGGIAVVYDDRVSMVGKGPSE